MLLKKKLKKMGRPTFLKITCGGPVRIWVGVECYNNLKKGHTLFITIFFFFLNFQSWVFQTFNSKGKKEKKTKCNAAKCVCVMLLADG